MLKAHQACIDLEKNVLRIQGREVRFLPEHELPDSARFFEGSPESTSSTVGASGSGSGSRGKNPGGTSGASTFPGSGQTLGSAPSRASSGQQASSTQPSRHSESSIQTLMDLGATREQAISLLDAAGGNVDVAASLMF